MIVKVNDGDDWVDKENDKNDDGDKIKMKDVNDLMEDDYQGMRMMI